MHRVGTAGNRRKTAASWDSDALSDFQHPLRGCDNYRFSGGFDLSTRVETRFSQKIKMVPKAILYQIKSKMKWSRLCLSDRIMKIWNKSKILYLRILKIKNRFLKNVSWRCPESGFLDKKYAAWDVSNGVFTLVAGAGFEPTTFGLWERV